MYFLPLAETVSVHAQQGSETVEGLTLRHEFNYTDAIFLLVRRGASGGPAARIWLGTSFQIRNKT